MRIHILGHSDSKLEGDTADWPLLVKGLLERELGEPIVMTGSRLAPYGPRALTYATRQVTEAAPEVVLLSVSAFACAVGLVYLRAGERFGERAQRLYEATEHRYSRFASRSAAVSPAHDRFVRSIARKFIGTATLAPVEEVGAVYAGILNELARAERLQVIVMGESFFSRGLQRANPGMVAKIETLRNIVRPAAEAHRFPWVDIEAAFATSGDREQYFLSDGVHNSAAGHHTVAQVVAAEIRRAASIEVDQGHG